jgi:hypothetical protein
MFVAVEGSIVLSRVRSNPGLAFSIFASNAGSKSFRPTSSRLGVGGINIGVFLAASLEGDRRRGGFTLMRVHGRGKNRGSAHRKWAAAVRPLGGDVRNRLRRSPIVRLSESDPRSGSRLRRLDEMYHAEAVSDTTARDRRRGR